MTSLGPLPFTVLILVAAWGVGTAAGRWHARGMPDPKPAVGGALFDVALVGLVVARIAFIVAWWPLYAADPWAVLRPGDMYKFFFSSLFFEKKFDSNYKLAFKSPPSLYYIQQTKTQTNNLRTINY